MSQQIETRQGKPSQAEIELMRIGQTVAWKVNSLVTYVVERKPNEYGQMIFDYGEQRGEKVRTTFWAGDIIDAIEMDLEDFFGDHS